MNKNDLTLEQVAELLNTLSDSDKEKLLWFARGMSAVSGNVVQV